jgi:hypothetical protein
LHLSQPGQGRAVGELQFRQINDHAPPDRHDRGNSRHGIRGVYRV